MDDAVIDFCVDNHIGMQESFDFLMNLYNTLQYDWEDDWGKLKYDNDGEYIVPKVFKGWYKTVCDRRD